MSDTETGEEEGICSFVCVVAGVSISIFEYYGQFLGPGLLFVPNDSKIRAI